MMTKEQAFQILSNVCEGISATRRDFKVIDEALMTLKPEPVDPEPVEPVKE
jgi:hypothetical protein